MDAHVEISGGEQGDAFAELVSMAIRVDPSLAERGASALAGSGGASASVVGAPPTLQVLYGEALHHSNQDDQRGVHCISRIEVLYF